MTAIRDIERSEPAELAIGVRRHQARTAEIVNIMKPRGCDVVGGASRPR